MRRGSLRWIAVAYVLSFLILAIADFTGYYLAEMGYLTVPSSIINSLRKIAGNPSILTIFIHNALLDVLMNIPAVGVVAYVFVLGETGLVLGYIAYAYIKELGLLAPIIGFITTALMPHGLVELFAYSLSAYNSVSLIVSAIRVRRLERSLMLWALLLLASLGILYVAAVIEYLELKLLAPVISHGITSI